MPPGSRSSPPPVQPPRPRALQHGSAGGKCSTLRSPRAGSTELAQQEAWRLCESLFSFCVESDVVMIRAVDKWLVGYLRSVLQRPGNVEGPKHLVLCIADHFEPFRGGASKTEARDLVRWWCDSYQKSTDGLLDADGKGPQQTFFYPQEDYDPVCIDLLADLCVRGCGEVEVHLHHRHDTPEGLRSKLTEFRDRLHSGHGLLGCDETGSPRYGFVHGNWALCNSRPDGDWCGVNEELGILRDTGCYADFTFPSAPSPTQPKTVNSIYYASDTPGKPRAHDHGTPVTALDPRLSPQVSGLSLHPSNPPSRLMLIQGPLALNWRRRKWGLLPRLENAEISGSNPPTEERVRLWAKQQIHVTGRAEWVFVKLHTHGCVSANRDVLFGEAMRRMHEHLLARYNDGTDWQLHYVTAREMYNTVRALESGTNPVSDSWRDFEIGAPEISVGV